MEYQYIVNPQTNRKCRVDSALGKRIIRNYMKQSGGDQLSVKRDYIESCIQEMKRLWNAEWELAAMQAQWWCLDNENKWIIKHTYNAADREYLHHDTILRILDLFKKCEKYPDSDYCEDLNELLNEF